MNQTKVLLTYMQFAKARSQLRDVENALSDEELNAAMAS